MDSSRHYHSSPGLLAYVECKCQEEADLCADRRKGQGGLTEVHGTSNRQDNFRGGQGLSHRREVCRPARKDLHFHEGRGGAYHVGSALEGRTADFDAAVAAAGALDTAAACMRVHYDRAYRHSHHGYQALDWSCPFQSHKGPAIQCWHG